MIRKNNKFISFLLTVLLVFALISAPPPTTVHAADIEFVDPDSGLKFKVLTEDDGSLTDKVMVMPNNYSGTAYTIPSKVTNEGIEYNVTVISNSAFSGYTTLAAIDIPDSVTEFGVSAFQDCTSLSAIIIPDSVTDIWDYAFYGCEDLESITFLGITPPTIRGFVFTETALGTVIVPAGTVVEYGFALSGKLPSGAHITPAAATITGVTVSPAAVEAARGETITFSAVVSGSGSFNPAVLWYVDSGDSDIDLTNGVLTVSEIESASYLTVTAISLADENVSGAAIVTVTSDAPQEEFSLPAGSTCYFDLSSVDVDAPLATTNSALPDIDLKWVPFTYIGTVNAYSLDESASGVTTASGIAAANASSRSLFLADTLVYKNISWNELNAAKLIFGNIENSYTANGVSYLLRSLSGGSNLSTPPSNEWDQILIKGNYIHNYDLYSWCQDTYLTGASGRILRGGEDEADHWEPVPGHIRYSDTGYRPALEILNADTLSSDALKTVTYEMGDNGTLGSGSLTTAAIVYAGELTLPEIIEANGFKYTGSGDPESGEMLGWNYGSTFYQAGTKLSTLPGGAVLTAGYGVPVQNNLPNLKGGIAATTAASVTVNTAYTLNLADIFEDADADLLTYKVSVNGAAATGAAVIYSYTPTTPGTTMLVFRANDGTADSDDTYTVVLNSNERTYSLIITAGNGGSLSISLDDNLYTVRNDTRVFTIYEVENDTRTFTFTITPDPGYSIASVLIDGVNNAAAVSSGNYAFTGITANHTINATFTSTSTGGGGDGGGGGGTGTTSEETSDVETSGNTATATTTTTATVDSSGNATAAVTKDQVSEAVNSAVAEAKKQGDDIAAVVEIKVEAPANSSSVETSIPKDAVDLVAKGGTDALKVSTPVASISFDTDALVGINKEASGDVKIITARVAAASLSVETQQLVGDRPVFDFSVTSGNKTISEFDGNVTVSVPYTPKAGEDTDAIVIYYINSEGKPEVVSNCKYDPVTKTVSFTTDHFSQYAVGYNKVSFSDVKTGAWYENAVDFAAARGIVAGTGNGNYNPDGKLTRGQLLVMLMRAYGIAPDTDLSGNFSDAGNTYYTGFLAAAKRLGITEGLGNNLYAPDSDITRQEMMTLLYNTLKVIDKLPKGNGKADGALTGYSDADSIASWAKDAAVVLADAGIIGGSNGKLSPQNTTTRAEMAQALYNLLSK